MKLKDYLKEMDGCEVSSITYEGVVGIRGKEVVRMGEVIDTLNLKKAKALFNEMFENEFGGMSLEELI